MKYVLFCFYSILLGLFLYACENSSSENNSVTQKFPKGVECKQKPEEISKIEMLPSATAQLEQLLDREYALQITNLKIDSNNLLLGRISKIWQVKNNYYLVDSEISQKIYSFEKNGKLRFVLDNKGEGSGQYQMLWDVQFNYFHERLEIWDISLHKLLFFDLEGKFINEQKVNLPIMSFFPVTKDWYAYHLDGRDNMGVKTPLLQLSDITGAQVINRGAYEYGMVDAMFTKQEFSYYHGSPYFLRPMMDTIYWIGPVNGQICPAYILDFKGKSIPEEAKKQDDLLKAGNIIQRSESCFTLGELVVGRTFMSFEWQNSSIENSQEHKYFAFTDRFQDKSYQIKEKDLQIFGIHLEKILAIDETAHNFIAYAFPHKINKEALNTAIDNKTLLEATRKELTKIQQLTDQEMPFLITFRLKHPESDGKP